jgi:DNA-binding MarR family transcriptional regulator
MSRPASTTLKNIPTQCPAYQLRAAARVVTRFYNECFKPLDLTSEQFSLLVGIANAPQTTIAALATESGADATTLSRNVQNLLDRGLLEAEGQRGRGGKRLSLSAPGRRLLGKALPAWAKARAQLASRLGEKKLGAARKSLAELAKAAADSSPPAR